MSRFNLLYLRRFGPFVSNAIGHRYKRIDSGLWKIPGPRVRFNWQRVFVRYRVGKVLLDLVPQSKLFTGWCRGKGICLVIIRVGQNLFAVQMTTSIPRRLYSAKDTINIEGFSMCTATITIVANSKLWSHW
jgi:hypothetical protein